MREVVAVFAKLGLLGFGGPAAHVAMLRREVVDRRRWVSDQRFADLFATSNLMPGPSSTELSLLLGRERAGWPGLAAAAVLFIGPAVASVLVLALLYVRYGSVPELRWVLYGVTPAVIGIVADAVVRMARTSLRSVRSVAIAIAALVLYVLGATEVTLLVGAGAVAAALARPPSGSAAAVGAMAPSLALASAAATAGMWTLFATFLKIGAVLYGSGYVLFAFLHGDFVEGLGWLTEQQLADAIAAGQMTPGPVFSTATFVGYVVAGVPGAVVATIGIFLPCFVFVFVGHAAVERLGRSPRAAAFLGGVTAAALALMATVTVELGRIAVVDVATACIAVVAFVIARRYEINAAWLVGAGALVGVGVKAAW